MISLESHESPYMRDETPQKIQLPLYYLLNPMNRLIWHIRDGKIVCFLDEFKATLWTTIGTYLRAF